MFLLASFVPLGSVHYKLVVKKINGLISELLFCFGAPELLFSPVPGQHAANAALTVDAAGLCPALDAAGYFR